MKKTPLLVVTGMSGAGRTTVLKHLEDLGFEAVDNLPLGLFKPLVKVHSELHHPMAIGVDLRTRGFNADLFLKKIKALRSESHLDVQWVFVDCDDDTLYRRFSTTRRKHPIFEAGSIREGIELERKSISKLMDEADWVIDTSDLSPAELKRVLIRYFGQNPETDISLHVQSFSYRYGIPQDTDIVWDVRFLKNPYYVPDLRPLCGDHKVVAEYLRLDPNAELFLEGLETLLNQLIPAYQQEGKAYLGVAFGCTGGQHRSVFVAEAVASWLKNHYKHVTLTHRDKPDDVTPIP